MMGVVKFFGRNGFSSLFCFLKIVCFVLIIIVFKLYCIFFKLFFYVGMGDFFVVCFW